MKKIVECVPNFSEGRDSKIIEAIANAIKQTIGCNLLDVDPGKSTNRTVYTFVGDPKSVVEGALNAAKTAKELIHMHKHSGEHPRVGALDVCPFIPVSNVSMEECVECAKEFAARVSEELNIPVYLYEEAQKLEYRKHLSQIREGEYEAIRERITKPEWKPDFGPAKFIPEWGVTVTGARNFLIAYNVNVLGTKEQAHRIALNIRENGRNDGNPGLLKEIKAIGWHVNEYNLAQISINLTNYKITGVHKVFETCKTEANALNVAVAGSELVGLIPLEAMLQSAAYYIEKEKLMIADEAQKIKLVVDRLGLNSITLFDPATRIIEYVIAEKENQSLAGLSVSDFIKSIAARSSAPGGGSASAAVSAIGTGLGCMVAQLTYGVRKFENVDKEMRRIIPVLHKVTNDLIPMIDADTNAFNDYMEAIRLPKATSEQIEKRTQAMQAGLKKAIDVPLTTMRLADSAWDMMFEVAKYGNIASKSDVEVGVKSLETGIWGAHKNVLINISEIKDVAYKQKVLIEANSLLDRAHKMCAKTLEAINERN
ncbi:MAG: glutamate formimidoyltransferase [Bacteroidales bacterium]|nr:glutamate formimidoyltransferase [Bacteroidales bacterium]